MPGNNEISNREQLVVFLAAQGKKTAEIAEAVNLSDSTVRTMLESERVQFQIKEIRYKLYGYKDHSNRFKQILPKAIDTAEQILTDPAAKPATKLAAATDLMDRALGKPKQTIEHEGSLIRNLYDRLDGKDAKPVIDAEVIPDSLPPVAVNPNESKPIDTTNNPNLQPIDEIDRWVSKNL